MPDRQELPDGPQGWFADAVKSNPGGITRAGTQTLTPEKYMHPCPQGQSCSMQHGRVQKAWAAPATEAWRQYPDAQSW